MNNARPILTIGIPTWNRLKELKEALDLVLPQAAAEGCVEVLICDNASEDQTGVYIRELTKTYSFVRYSCNDRNIGADRNFIKTLWESSGIYVWILSDDDFLEPGAVHEVLRIVKTHNPSYISLNYLFCDERRNVLPVQRHMRYQVEQDFADANVNQVFQLRNHWLSFLSSNIYKRDLADFDDFELNISRVPNWIQVYMAAQIISTGKAGYLSSYVGVLSRVGNDRTNTAPFVINMPDSFTYILQRFNAKQSVIREVLNEIRRTFLPFAAFLAYRALNRRMSPLLVPAYYRFALLVPREVILWAWKIKRVLSGRPLPA